MKIHTAIVAINSKYIHASLAPWYLLASVEQYGTAVVTAEVVEGTINESADAVAARIIAAKPDVIGLGCYIWNITFVKRLLPLIKKALPGAAIILGGPEVSYNAGDILRGEPLADYIIAGEGEKPLAMLVDALAAGETSDGIPGVCFRRDGEIIAAPPYCPPDCVISGDSLDNATSRSPFEDPPDPYTDAYFRALHGRITYIETSRGCPFSCAFCLSGREGKVRYFALDRAKRDILRLAASGTQTVKFVDRTFNADRKRAGEIWGFILENYGSAIPKGVCFHFEIAGDLLDEAALTLLGTAPRGLFQFEIGLQSFNEKTLEAVRRKTDTNRLKRNIERLIATGNIHVHIDLIAGLPYEDVDSFEDSFNSAYALRPHMLQFGFLKLLHGAEMRLRSDRYPCRFSPEPPYAVLETPWLTGAELEALHAAERALDRLYNSCRFRRTLEHVLRQTGLTPFGLFAAAGAQLAESFKGRLSLDDLTALVFDYFGTLPGIDRKMLRDALVCDRLATDAGGRLPEVLLVPDARRKKVLTAINTAEETRLQKGVKRGFALLSAENAAVWTDYTEKDPVTGEYELHRVTLDEL